MNSFPNLEALGQGCVSGSICEWPQLKVEARKAINYIERLEAVVRAGDALIAAYNDNPPVGGLGQASDQYFAARARVNLSELPDSSPSSQAPLDNSKKEASDAPST